MDRTGRPPPRMRSKSALPVSRRSRLDWFAITEPLRGREDSPLLKPGNLFDTADDDLPGQFRQQRSKLGDQLAQRNRRVLELPDQSARKRVGVSRVGPHDGELAELRAAGHRTLRGAPQKRGGRRGAENVCNRIPDQLEQRSAAHLGAAVVDAGPSAVRNVRWPHLPPTL